MGPQGGEWVRRGGGFRNNSGLGQPRGFDQSRTRVRSLAHGIKFLRRSSKALHKFCVFLSRSSNFLSRSASQLSNLLIINLQWKQEGRKEKLSFTTLL